MTAPESEFELQLRASNVPFEREFMAIPGRRYRWDFRIADTRYLVEIQGGTWIKGGHSTGAGIQRDCTKAQLAVAYGWIPVPFTSQDVHDCTAIDWVCERLLKGAGGE